MHNHRDVLFALVLQSSLKPLQSHLHYMKVLVEVDRTRSMDDNCGEWVESMGVPSGCGYQEVGVASRWNLWVWLSGGGYGRS